jgi:hypothetical protein
MNEIDSTTQESVMKRKKKMGGSHTKPPGKQVAGHKYKSNLTPMAISAKRKSHKTIRYKKIAKR